MSNNPANQGSTANKTQMKNAFRTVPAPKQKSGKTDAGGRALGFTSSFLKDGTAGIANPGGVIQGAGGAIAGAAVIGAQRSFLKTIRDANASGALQSRTKPANNSYTNDPAFSTLRCPTCFKYPCTCSK
ncbi:hypothetical protein CC2G_014639 [Coprinopsis cinerea AmutBmut pab1-1]|nr:hypothetical protein CC2G_014639 [Coprinopsis cinerea AmutBmut pab1-1]